MPYNRNYKLYLNQLKPGTKQVHNLHDNPKSIIHKIIITLKIKSNQNKHKLNNNCSQQIKISIAYRLDIRFGIIQANPFQISNSRIKDIVFLVSLLHQKYQEKYI